MILSAQSIRHIKPVTPFHERAIAFGMSYGLSGAGYDVRIAQSVRLDPGEFMLASTVEAFHMPDDVMGQVGDKSTWARRGLAVQNTWIEPGWYGWLTLELTNHGPDVLRIAEGCPIAQIIFMQLDQPTEQPYRGKYQSQPQGPQPAILEKQNRLPGL